MSKWVDSVLRGDHSAAKDIANQMSSPPVLSGDISTVSRWLREKRRGLTSPSFLLIADWASQKVAESRARCGFWSDFLTPNFLLPNFFTYSSLARHPRAEPF